ncbi:2-isopropylmalate synthase [Alkaliphilus peptidifermentans]|uniref:2-isopropylmalate synthase n=1 Tax=Alkaliphilus peptidifermentans DSM 18978 TaxID=1120976 RepID=A0A1G5JL84_9FIRM|nr:2-isopropylmalate synthase [Alkaliphilus peptidifermentans]SCY89087.1 2-isopropylmalate synthase [Alkaliphilus peptidifermentans DSM 18978]
MREKIHIFDTTLRDGEQSPGCSLNIQEKLKIAKRLELLRVDVIEAGFAIASPGDFASVKAIAETVKDCRVASLSRVLKKDIDAAWEAIKMAAAPRIHTFIATSDIHMQYKLKMSPDAVLQQAVDGVKYAKGFCNDVEFSAEDASRSNPEFLYRIFEAVIKAGATVINVPDTVGYTMPEEFFKLIKGIKENVSNIDKATISVHCHNDLGMAVANTIAAAKAGATQLECTINGIGERAGNAALEELVMTFHTRRDLYNYDLNIDTTQIYPTSRLVSKLTGVKVQPNKAIVGNNAFAHESGIHQHGVLANRETYEIMTPESVGLTQNKMVLGKHSGRHAFEDRLKDLGYQLPKVDIDKIFDDFKLLADKKKVVYDGDLEALVQNKNGVQKEVYKLKEFVINSGNLITATATIKLSKDGEEMTCASTGDGPVDAALKAVDNMIDDHFVLEEYSLNAVSEGKDAQGEVIVRISSNKTNRLYLGRGLSTDIVESSIKAYLNAINKLLNELEFHGEVKLNEK